MRLSGAGMPTSASRSMARLRAAVSDRLSVGPDGLDQLIADPVQRIEAGQRILKDHADPLAPDAAHLFRRQIVDPQSRQIDLAAGDAAGRIDQADDGEPGDGFAGAGFADHAQHLALGDVEGNAVDGAQHAAAGDELDLEIAHGENGLGHADVGMSRSSQFRIERVAQPVAEQVDRQDQAPPAQGPGRRRSTIRRRTDSCCRSGSGCRARAWCRACRSRGTTASPR